jgi:hypothetical protein
MFTDDDAVLYSGYVKGVHWGRGKRERETAG